MNVWADLYWKIEKLPRDERVAAGALIGIMPDEKYAQSVVTLVNALISARVARDEARVQEQSLLAAIGQISAILQGYTTLLARRPRWRPSRYLLLEDAIADLNERLNEITARLAADPERLP